MGAMRTLGHAASRYEDLGADDQSSVDTLVEQIVARNDADRTREVQPIVPPAGAPTLVLPDSYLPEQANGRFMAVVDTSASMSKHDMSRPVIDLIVSNL
jgi:cytidylate kinase